MLEITFKGKIKRLAFAYNVLNVSALVVQIFFWIALIGSVAVILTSTPMIVKESGIPQFWKIVMSLIALLYLTNRLHNFLEGKAYKTLSRHQQLKQFENVKL